MDLMTILTALLFGSGSAAPTCNASVFGWESDEINFDVDAPRSEWRDGPPANLQPISREDLSLLVGK